MADTLFQTFWQGNGGLVAAPKARFAGSPLRAEWLRFPLKKEQCNEECASGFWREAFL
ncbi:hypothetical protein [uncultured Mailhella sp.]|uniref:hypothetical protein n=1 Tax=uncultured Mailhella sp. TaxID=1981031 RepID=UPI0032086602